jgi:dTMP kinase
VGVAQLWVATLSAGAAGYSIMFGTVFTGLAVGMLIGPKVLPAYTRSRVFGLAIGSAGIALLTMSIIRDFILADLLAATVGLFAGMAWIIGYTLIGQEVEDRLRGRIFAFVLSSVRLMLLLTIAVGPVIAGRIGSHSIGVGDESRLRFSGPGLTLLIGGILALGVSYYATSRATRSPTRLRDIVRRRIMSRGVGHRRERRGLFLAVDGVEPDATAAYAALLARVLRARRLVVVETAEPAGAPVGHQVDDLMRALAVAEGGVEPEAAALLSAADRAQHVAATIRPALERGEAIVCDRYVLTSIAVHGGGRGASVDRIRQVNGWGTGGLMPDLTLVVDGLAGGAEVLAHGFDDVDVEGIRHTFLEAADADPDRCIVCPVEVPPTLPEAVLERLQRLIDARASVLAVTPEEAASDGTAPAEQPASPEQTRAVQ